MKTRHDFILDFETIGQSALVCPVIDVSYMTFDWGRFLNDPYSFEELLDLSQKDKLNIKDQVDNYKCKFSQSDLNFWLQQPKEVQANIKPSSIDITVDTFVNRLIKYLRESEKIDYWWSRSNTFDPIILQRLTTAVKQDALVNEYIKYWRVRDIRTFIDAKFNWSTRNGFVPILDENYWNSVFKAHDSRHDIAADILRLQTIYRVENDFDQTER